MRHLIAGCAFVLAACGGASTDAEEVVKSALKDPESAQFQDVRECTGDRSMVIGKVNAKNEMGGYAGFEQFIVAGGTAYFLNGDAIAYSRVLSRCIGSEPVDEA